LGRPATLISSNDFSTYARKRGEGWEANWFVARAVTEYLFRIIMGTRHSQSAFNPEKDANGLHQGGLGLGVTGVPSAEWSEHNNNNPLVPTSVGVELGDGCGEVSYDIKKEDDTLLRTVKIPVFFGLKHLYGNLWTFARGLTYDIGAEKSLCYIAPSMYNNYDPTTIEGMILAGEMPRRESYIKKLSMNKLCCAPTEVGGSSTSYYADYFYANPTSYPGLRCRLCGGSSNFGSLVGAFVSYSHFSVTATATHFSSSLCFFTQDPLIE